VNGIVSDFKSLGFGPGIGTKLPLASWKARKKYPLPEEAGGMRAEIVTRKETPPVTGNRKESKVADCAAVATTCTICPVP
jgi:hypothetical protein